MKILSTDEVMLLSVTIDNNVTLKNHLLNYAEKHQTFFYQKKKLGYMQILLLIVSFFTLLKYGCLLVKVQLTKPAKFISGHSQIVHI